MVQANSEFVRLLRTFSPCHMVTGASDGFAPNFSSKASASWFSSSSVKTWGSRLRAANSLRPIASRVARADYPQAQACPHTPRTSGKEGLEDDVGEVGLLGNDLLQLLGRNGQNLPMLARHGLKGHRLPRKHVQVAHEAARAEDTHRAARFTREVVGYLHLAFEDDDEVVGQGARPKENLPDLLLPRLPVASSGHRSDLSSASVPSCCGSSSRSPEIRDSAFRTILSINADCYALVSGAAYAYSSATNP